MPSYWTQHRKTRFSIAIFCFENQSKVKFFFAFGCWIFQCFSIVLVCFSLQRFFLNVRIKCFSHTLCVRVCVCLSVWKPSKISISKPKWCLLASTFNVFFLIVKILCAWIVWNEMISKWNRNEIEMFVVFPSLLSFKLSNTRRNESLYFFLFLVFWIRFYCCCSRHTEYTTQIRDSWIFEVKVITQTYYE